MVSNAVPSTLPNTRLQKRESPPPTTIGDHHGDDNSTRMMYSTSGLITGASGDQQHIMVNDITTTDAKDPNTIVSSSSPFSIPQGRTAVVVLPRPSSTPMMVLPQEYNTSISHPPCSPATGAGTILLPTPVTTGAFTRPQLVLNPRHVAMHSSPYIVAQEASHILAHHNVLQQQVIMQTPSLLSREQLLLGQQNLHQQRTAGDILLSSSTGLHYDTTRMLEQHGTSLPYSFIPRNIPLQTRAEGTDPTLRVYMAPNNDSVSCLSPASGACSASSLSYSSGHRDPMIVSRLHHHHGKVLPADSAELHNQDHGVHPTKHLRRRRVFRSFHERLEELISFKAIHGHCNVPRRHGDYKSLGVWCNNIRYSYRQIQDGQKPHNAISKDEISILDKLGFQWCLRNENVKSNTAGTKDDAPTVTSDRRQNEQEELDKKTIKQRSR